MESSQSTRLEEVAATGLYLDLMKRVLTRYQFPEPYLPLRRPSWPPYKAALPLLRKLLSKKGLELVRRSRFNPADRTEGKDWPADAETMVGLRRLDNLQFCISDVVQRGVVGDLIETGVWRGGASIFARAVLKAYGDTSRLVWLADSFQGLPKPNVDEYPSDATSHFWAEEFLAVSLDEVKSNFTRYGLLDEQVRFLVGWFKDTLPTAPIERLSILRLDGDMYESTIQALDALYPKLSRGGYRIIDDHHLPECRKAVADYRGRAGITDEIRKIDW